jgi:hypothetical protein
MTSALIGKNIKGALRQSKFASYFSRFWPTLACQPPTFPPAIEGFAGVGGMQRITPNRLPRDGHFSMPAMKTLRLP